MYHLDVQNITKCFEPSLMPAVSDASFHLESGEIFGLVGPSGCGKTTTLRIIAGFEHPDSGDILLDGVSIGGLPPEKRKIGFVFQDYALFPNRSVVGNVMFGLRGVERRNRKKRGEELLELVGLEREADRMPHELSGGQQQRVALARTLASNPELILLDEPFSNLDAALRETTRRDIRTLLKCADVSAILVTHDQEEALSFCDRVGVMHAGALEQVGRPEEIYLHPETSFVAQFLGRANLLRGTAKGAVAETELGTIPIVPDAEGPVLLSLRPEHLGLSPADASGTNHSGEVISREFRGHDVTFRVRFGHVDYLAHTEYTGSLSVGSKVSIYPREPAVVLRETGLCRRALPSVAHSARWAQLLQARSN
ncbi:MAG: ABC transporter ATP-binding protein [Spirochaetaceae bacterium]|nr:MAG: ABC transporter ATP-binding protein [Spirochaetaceae bacterium]